MNSGDIWAPEQMRREWQSHVSHRAVTFFEKFVSAEDRKRPKTKAEHAAENGIPHKYIVRALDFFAQLQLLSLSEQGDHKVCRSYKAASRQI
jgi:hypothetical protein